jgi:hypothetical protein
MNTRANTPNEVPAPTAAPYLFASEGGVFEVQGDALKRMAGNATVEPSEPPSLEASTAAAGGAANNEVKP